MYDYKQQKYWFDSLKIKFEVMKINVTVNDMMSFKDNIYQRNCNINSTYQYIGTNYI